jgi:lathosterol oxidase
LDDGRRYSAPVPPIAQTLNRHYRSHAISTLTLGAVTTFVTAVLTYTGVIVVHLAWPTPLRAAIEVVAYVLAFEAYFYPLHRLLHVRAVFRRIHIVHHRSVFPNPLSGLALHPVEAMGIIGFLPIAMWAFPIHLVSLVIVILYLSGSILLAHARVGLFPAWWARVPVLNWYVAPDVHVLHHARGNCNYGATLSILDRVFGTLGVPGGQGEATRARAATTSATAGSVGAPVTRTTG